MIASFEIAPEDWSYHCFPIGNLLEEVISLDDVAAIGIKIVRAAIVSNDHTMVGMPIHWAHRFVNSQSDVGDWPLLVNARTGTVISGKSRSLPTMFLKELGELLQTSEFDGTILLAECQ